MLVVWNLDILQKICVQFERLFHLPDPSRHRQKEIEERLQEGNETV